MGGLYAFISLILGVLAILTPALIITKAKKFIGKVTFLAFVSMCFCSLSVYFQVLMASYYVDKGDFSTLVDVIFVSSFMSIFLIVLTIILNMIAISYNWIKKKKEIRQEAKALDKANELELAQVKDLKETQEPQVVDAIENVEILQADTKIKE